MVQRGLGFHDCAIPLVTTGMEIYRGRKAELTRLDGDFNLQVMITSKQEPVLHGAASPSPLRPYNKVGIRGISADLPNPITRADTRSASIGGVHPTTYTYIHSF